MNKTVAAIAAFSFLFIIGCNNTENALGYKEDKSSTLRYPIPIDPLTYDPAIVQDNHTLELMQQIYENLVTLTNGHEIAPKLAKRWDVKKNGLLYIFHLKKGVRFHNGQEMTAEDVKWSIERSCNPSLASPTAANYLDDIEGVDERLRGEVPGVSGIRVLGRYKLSITLKNQCPYFLGKLTFPVAAVIPKSSPIRIDENITDLAKVIGTGPFKIERYVPHQIIILKAFKKYHEGAPKIAYIERPIIRDQVTRINKFKAGELDIVPLDRRDIDSFKKQPDFLKQIQYHKRPGILTLCFNQGAFQPFKKKRIRKAFAIAVDKNVIIDQILGGIHTAANGFIPWGVPGYNSNRKPIDFNPEKARQILVEEGFGPGNPFPKLELCVREDRPDSKIMGEAIVMQLRKHLKINVKLRYLDYNIFLYKRNNGELPFYCNSWIADYLDPHNFLRFLYSTNSFENRIGYSNSEFDYLCGKADRRLISKTRIDIYQKAEDVLIKDLPALPICYLREVEIVHSRVKGLRPSPFGYLAHSQVELLE